MRVVSGLLSRTFLPVAIASILALAAPVMAQSAAPVAQCAYDNVFVNAGIGTLDRPGFPAITVQSRGSASASGANVSPGRVSKVRKAFAAGRNWMNHVSLQQRPNFNRNSGQG